ncbi:hypothetical protein CHS0354_028495 [Potamilus streckersoni]|uniref:Peptidoglycan recognition protein n=1 Tax=Potamilus streckersoni TaxID=2493646 RepID=A0AAE0VUE4_9BIVA|nr:hypothetical protein CHS0354_028495 [Potamilus streckersoni]
MGNRHLVIPRLNALQELSPTKTITWTLTVNWSDIGYSFLIGEDGNVYEGRGWDAIGAHTLNYNSVGLGFCMIGNFMDHVPNDAALAAVKQMIACGVSNHKISSSYILHGHRDVGQTDCPGNKLYDLIQSWPHYSRHQG